jgi:D-xylose transport system substrate-binding protein
VSYDRLITNAPIDYYISFDNVQVGKLQATALLQKIGTSPKKTIVMINGAPTDNNAKLFKQGAHSVLDGKVKIGAEYDTPDWSPDQAQTEMDQAITKLGKTGFQGVYCANDGTAGGAIAAMMGAGINPQTRPTTGQDAELAGIQRILLGQQYMTVYKAIKPEAYDAAELAYSLAKGTSLPASLTITTTANGSGDIKSVILTPVAVTAANIKDTVVADGFWTTAKILTSPALKAAGAKVGLQ